MQRAKKAARIRTSKRELLGAGRVWGLPAREDAESLLGFTHGSTRHTQTPHCLNPKTSCPVQVEDELPRWAQARIQECWVGDGHLAKHARNRFSATLYDSIRLPAASRQCKELALNPRQARVQVQRLLLSERPARQRCKVLFVSRRSCYKRTSCLGLLL